MAINIRKKETKFQTRENGESGITLVALVITIIVLLILATVSINLVINNGILDKAKSAVDKYSDSEIEEQIKLTFLEYEMAKLSNVNLDASIYMKNSLEKKYGKDAVNISKEDNVFHIEITFSNGSKKYYLDNGEIGILKPLENYGVKIGDIVYYDEGVSHTYTVDTTKGAGGSLSGYDSNTKKYKLNSKTFINENLIWRVLGVNNKGQIELISENPTTDLLYLADEEGWIYSEKVLNEFCDNLYGKGTGAESARSLKQQDIYKLIENYTPPNGDIWEYRFPEEGDYMQYKRIKDDENKTIITDWTNITNNQFQIFRMLGESTTLSINNRNNKGISVKNSYALINNLSNIKHITNDGKKFSDIIGKGSGENNIVQWFANKTLKCTTVNVSFNVCTLNNDGNCLYSTGEYKYCFGQKVRPVVTLSSNNTLNGNSEEGWTIN
ncbi:MAG: hypothetical protein IKG14_04585 [Clostridia bacterium]|nr:hypothetical protein [Clostridia bacterium]